MTPPTERLLAQVRQRRASGLPLRPGEQPPPLILESWMRCADAGMGVDTVPRIPVLGDAELRRRRERAGLVRQLALAELETLSQQIAGSNFLLAFGDREGVVLDLCADHRFATSSSGAGILAGSRWDEAGCGTNGLGTALASGRSVAVSGPEHYLLHFGDIACTASPIRDAWGEVVGVLDASSYVDSRQRHTQALVQMAATHIENQLLAQQMRDGLVLAFHPRAEYLATLSAGLIAFDGEGRLRCINERGRALLTGLALHPGTPFEALFDARFDDTLHRLRRGEPLALADALGSALVLGAVALAGAPLPATPAPPPAVVTAPPAALRRIDSRPYLAGDPAVDEALRTVAAAVRLRVPLLIHGETGTGKEQLARHAHEASGRGGAFVAVNCGALPAELVEAELFGHAPGAFTGARREGHAGLIASADGGTLLLDELAELPLALQSTLLRFLDDQQLRPVGSSQQRRVDVQLVAASHVPLEQAVAAGRFRADLLYRLNTVRVSLPPLRQRRDFEAIVSHLLAELDGSAAIAPEALALLARHAWPGNFRELRAVLTRALLAGDGPGRRLDATDLARQLPALATAGPEPVGSALQLGATALVLREFERTGGSVSRVSRNLGISRTTVYRHLRAGGRH